MSHTILENALLKQERRYVTALDRLRELASDEAESEVSDITFLLREAVEVTGCARRLLKDRTVTEVHAAFGAPGDFGYETPIGDALARTYRGA